MVFWRFYWDWSGRVFHCQSNSDESDPGYEFQVDELEVSVSERVNENAPGINVLWWIVTICIKIVLIFLVKSRKRVRRYESHKAFVAKQRVEQGFEHVTKKKQKLIEQKIFKPQSNCKCDGDVKKQLKCPEKITIDRQKKISMDIITICVGHKKHSLFVRV